LIAGEESARQVLGQINELRRILPSAKIVLVRNERDGCPVAEAKELPADLRKTLEQALKSYRSIRMPRLRLKSRRIYEKLGLPPSTIIAWHRDYYREAIARTGRPLLEAKRLVKDIAAWSESVRAELVGLLPFLGAARMTSKLDVFLKDVKSATAKADAADAEVVGKLKTLSAEDFARLPRSLLSHLSERQYRRSFTRSRLPSRLNESRRWSTPTDQARSISRSAIGFHGRRSRRALQCGRSSGSDRWCRRRANVGMVVVWQAAGAQRLGRGMAALSAPDVLDRRMRLSRCQRPGLERSRPRSRASRELFAEAEPAYSIAIYSRQIRPDCLASAISAAGGTHSMNLAKYERRSTHAATRISLLVSILVGTIACIVALELALS
jgi:hypothetical protein